MIALNVRSINYNVRTRAQRRAALASIVKILTRIRDAEIECLTNNPVGYTISQYIGENAVEHVDYAIDYLAGAYDYDRHITEALSADSMPF